MRASVRCRTLVAPAEFSEQFTGDDYQRVADEYERGTHQILRGNSHMIMWKGVVNTVERLIDFLA